ncbi:SRPBCC family protein [Conexibacter arvalis]|uniref:SRPBCC domain-containing protein n=1 Tax=Conexibacter arvalis TaxID=912552 RepID=A0A840IIT5_9ACTN|nr:SRPBCC domain-containing protein [Conexibacter arvalis]MBB4664255.1 hypothetical protein [Conexibacter arvalis]
MTDADPVVVELTIAAPAAEVWRALRDPAELRRWHGWDYDQLDAEIRAIYLDDVTADAEALTLDTHGGGRFELEPAGERKTVVRLTRAAPAGAASWDGIYDEVNEGWTTFLQQLRCYLERHRGRERRSAKVERPAALPAGEPWFRSQHQEGVVTAEGALVIRARGHSVLNAWATDAETFAALAARLG